MHAYKRLNFDIPLFLATILLVTGGVLMVFSASGLKAAESHHQQFYYMIQQILGAVAGFAIVVFLLSAKKAFYLKPLFVYGLLALTEFLLVVCLAMPSIAHTHRWLVLLGFRFQPSELAKISLVLFFAWFCENRKDNLNEWKTLALPLGVLAGTVLLVLLEPDFGTAVLLAGISGMMLIVGGVKFKRLALVGGVFAVVFGIFLFNQAYRVNRIQGFLAPGEDLQGKGYQVNQSKVAVGSGGLLGVGPGQSTQKLYFLPFAHTDFIFSIVGEETGLVGGLITLGLFVLVLWRGLKIAIDSTDPTNKMIAAGITFALAAQALLNISIVLGIGPPKGTPLPFLSYGRSSLMCSLAAVGFLLHISQKKGDTGRVVRI
jgi:cell division protein FtsW